MCVYVCIDRRAEHGKRKLVYMSFSHFIFISRALAHSSYDISPSPYPALISFLQRMHMDHFISVVPFDKAGFDGSHRPTAPLHSRCLDH